MTDYHPQGLWGTGDTAVLRGVKADTSKHVAAQKLRSYRPVTILTSQHCFHSARSHTYSVTVPIGQKLNPKSD